MLNKVVLMGHLAKDPMISFGGADKSITIARYTLAVNRRVRKDQENSADFISCVVFGKGAEFAEKYLKKGTKMVVFGHIQTGSYTNKDGQKVYTTDVIVDEQEFAESKRDGASSVSRQEPVDTGFINPPEDEGEDNLPFN